MSHSPVAPTGSVSLPDVELAFRWHGPREGRPLVLVHGFTGSSDDWREQLEPLSRIGPTVALDLRGHGDSSNPGDEALYDLAGLVDDLARALSELGIESCDLLGHSMGGMVALRFALEFPERTRSLVLMDTSDSPLSLGPSAIMDRVMEAVREGGTRALLGMMRSRADERSEAELRYRERVGTEAAWARIEAKLEVMDPAAFVGLAAAMSGSESLRSRLSEIRCPALVLVGEEDEPFRKPSDAMAQGLRQATRVVIPDAAHSPQLENPAAWLAAIREHLERVRSGLS